MTARQQWLRPVILATQEAEITSTQFDSALESSSGDPFLKKHINKRKSCGVTETVGPVFK
jgi:hypothetical protein